MTKTTRKLIFDPIERFWKSVKCPIESESCWEWIGRKNYKGYGDMKINNKHVMAHRFSWIIANGKDIPKGLCVCHKCDNPSCVNPDHLFLGTIQDNNLDRDKKGRKALGEQNGKSKLTLEQVKEIKRLLDLGFSCSEIAKDFEFPHSTIRSIKVGRSWSWVE